MTLQDTIQALSDPEFRDLKAWIVTTETDRRAAMPAVEQARAEVVTELQDAGKLDKPEVATAEQATEQPATVPVWRDPGTDHARMYHYGDVLQHNGNIVRSTHPGLNHWEPGTLAFDGRIWEIIGTVAELQAATEQPEPEPEPETETATEPSAPEFKQPTGAPDAYKKGDHVTYNGQVYESTIDNNAYSPDAYPAGWRKIA